MILNYVGRFAPSPTGPLHFGSLIAAVASYCDAKANSGKWLIRMENVDKPREVPGAADAILRTLEAFGFLWDEAIVYQSQRDEVYEAYLNNLKHKNHVYVCACSRKEIADSATQNGVDGAIYPKTCFSLNRSRENNMAADRMDIGAWRINADDAGLISFNDAVQGAIAQTLKTDVGDFILKRKDGLFAYQLAVVVDDALQNITHIVRGADLLDSTPRQIYLQHVLGFSTPNYAHVPVVVNAQGEKLSKQTLAKPVESNLAAQQIVAALQFLGQAPPADLHQQTLPEIWIWAIKNWRVNAVPKTRFMPAK